MLEEFLHTANLLLAESIVNETHAELQTTLASFLFKLSNGFVGEKLLVSELMWLFITVAECDEI